MTDFLRVDVSGVPVSVRNHGDVDHLIGVNRKLAIAKLALHKILLTRGDVGAMVAAQALENMRDD